MDDLIFSNDQIETLQKAVEIMNEIAEIICEIMKPITEAVIQCFNGITRVLFNARLVADGLPSNVALWISGKWPEKWLPYKWAWSFLC